MPGLSRVFHTRVKHAAKPPLARRFVPLLSWRETARAAAQELDVDPNALGSWLRAWRQWLLLIDPGGSMEGARAAWACHRAHGA